MLNFTEAEINDKLLNMVTQSEVKGYWWKKGTTEEAYSSNVKNSYVPITNYTSEPTATTIVYYADSFTVNYHTGMFTLTNPSYIALTYYDYANASTLSGKYFIIGSTVSSTMYLGALDSAVSRNSTGYRVTMNKLTVIDKARYNVTFIEYVHDMNSNAYPNKDFADDGYWYYDKIALLESPNYMDVDKYELLATHSEGSTPSTYTVLDLSQYSYFYVVVLDADGLNGSPPVFIPASQFRVPNKQISMSVIAGQYMYIKYLSNTQIIMYIATSNLIYFYGMK